MNDPRTKRPTTADLIEKRHQQWLNSLKTSSFNSNSNPVVIKLRTYHLGKTATVLSERELEVLQLVSFGNGTRDVAEKLSLSVHTITNHRKNMLSRSRCGNFAELVRVAINENLL